MKRIICSALIVHFLAFPLVTAAPTLAQDQMSHGKITVEYGASTFTDVSAMLKRRMVLEELQEFLSPLRLPKDLKILAKDCGAPTLPYVPGAPITICYDLINQIMAQSKRIYPDDTSSQYLIVTGATIEAVLHQTARAIFDVLQVPIWGREGDAADRLAALMMMQFGEDLEKVTIYGTTTLFKSLASSESTWTGSDFADRASPEAQRYYNYLCIAVAGDPAIFGGAVANGTIPKFRAADCKHEYEQIVTAFDLRIMPYVDPDQLVKVRATQWLDWPRNN